MTENKWLNFAGFLNGCIHDMEHPKCPFKQYRSMDQYQRLEFLIAISESDANEMMNSCMCHQEECTPLSFHKLGSDWGVAVAI